MVPSSPLACYEQVLHVTITVTSLVTGAAWPGPAGRFLITSTDVDGGKVSVTGKSLMHRLEEDRFVYTVMNQLLQYGKKHTPSIIRWNAKKLPQEKYYVLILLFFGVVYFGFSFVLLKNSL